MDRRRLMISTFIGIGIYVVSFTVAWLYSGGLK